MKILVTAGPTREPLDPVRYLSNRSSGKMGYAIAQAALDAGHDVVLVSGPVALVPPKAAETVQVNTSDEMYEAVHSRVAWADVCVLCAAVADFRPVKVEALKIKKGTRSSLVLELVPTRDILRSLRDVPRANDDPRPIVVGFAAETNDLLEHAREKLHAKGCAPHRRQRCEPRRCRIRERRKRTHAAIRIRRNSRARTRAKKRSCGIARQNIFGFFQIVVDDQ